MRGTARLGDQPEGSFSAEVVRQQLARMLASADFDASERNRRFLSYIIEERLAGRGDRIKAYSIAIAVFDRDDGFNPQADPIVRIEAGRLRRSLEHYYLLAGKDDPVRIEIPKGGYVPVFRPHSDDASFAGLDQGTTARPDDAPGSEAAAPQRKGFPTRRERFSWRLLVPRSLLALAVVFGLVVVGLAVPFLGRQIWTGQDQPLAGTPLGSRPSLMVAPFENLTDEPTDYFAEGVAQEVLSNLVRFKEFIVFDARTSLEVAQADPLDFGRRLGADYVVTGTVRREAGRVRVNSQLVNLTTGVSIWAASYDEELAVERLFEIQDGIAANVAATVAQPYGVVYRDALDQLRRDPPSSLRAYECLLQAYAYRRRIARGPHGAVRSCLEEAVVDEPEYANALAMLAMVYVDEFRFGFNPRPDHYDPLDKALAMAQRAVDTVPDDALARMALFETLFFRGELEQAFATGERAVTLNPNNPEPRAMLGLRLAHSGQWERGVALVEEALRMNPAPPGWYYFPLSMNAFRQGDDEAALDWAKKIDMPGLFWTHVVLAAVYGQLERKDDAAEAAARLLEVYPDFEARALIELGRQHLEPAVMKRMIDGLRKAGLGVPEPIPSADQLG